jgi:hypothetical protein
MVLELLASLHERNRDIEAMRHRIDLLLRRLYGPRGERLNPDQLLLFAEMAASQDTAPAPPEPAAAKPRRRCWPHGRRRLPDNLPREALHHELSQADRVCPAWSQVRVDIGTDRSEQLDDRPASTGSPRTSTACGRRPDTLTAVWFSVLRASVRSTRDRPTRASPRAMR